MNERRLPPRGSRLVLIAALAGGLLGACAQQPGRLETIQRQPQAAPVNLSGSWERDYSRGDNVNDALGRMFRRLNRSNQNYGGDRYGGTGAYGFGLSPRDVNAVLALARLAELVTRPTVLTISQGETELKVARDGDYDMSCQFVEGMAYGSENLYGAEACGWQGEQFVSRLVLPEGLVVNHRFTIAPDQDNLHVATTVSQRGIPIPFTLNRFYTRFVPVPSANDCLETLSRKRVCTRGPAQ